MWRYPLQFQQYASVKQVWFIRNNIDAVNPDNALKGVNNIVIVAVQLPFGKTASCNCPAQQVCNRV
jgi:hypothetical protein